MTDPHPWERQPGESLQAWRAFVAYRDMRNRSLVKVAEQLGESRQLMDRWSSRHQWVARVSAWETEQDRDWARQLTAARRHIAKRHVQTAQAFLTKAVERLNELNPALLSPADTVKWAEFALKVERGIYGLGDDPEEGAASVGGVRIVIDPRLLPVDSNLAAVDDDSND